MAQLSSILGNLPRGTAALIGAAAGLIAVLWPRKTAPAKLDYLTTVQRDKYYGPIQYIPSPTTGNPEGVLITNDFHARNIITKDFPLIGKAQIHKIAAPSLEAALQEIQKKGLGSKIKTFAGGYYPRFVRGSQTNLSSHSYGTSIDINADTNPLWGQPTADQQALATIFAKHGWYWGANFSRPDPMHFEYVIPPQGAVA